MGPIRPFLDANVLYSAALDGPSFDLIWQLAKKRKVELVTNRTCRLEAKRNLDRKRPQQLGTFAALLADARELPDAKQLVPADIDIAGKNAPVYATAVAAQADVLLTGDRKHFAHLMKRTDLPLRVRTVRDFLREGQP